MTIKNNIGKNAAVYGGHARPFLLIMISLTIVLAGCQDGLNRNDIRIQSINNGSAVLETHEQDPVLSLLGKTFGEIKQVMGEPDEEGFEDWLGPHDYILYRIEKGFIRFCSPEYQENEIAVNILLGEGQAVLGAKVGMSFQEIIEILLVPDIGPEVGMDNFYYADYFSGVTNQGVPDVFISFVAYSMDSPTKYALVKLEAIYNEETELVQIKK
ncbi:MAG: hypothetical protein JXB33_03690 [Clostridia bacterium]|nr:hypothetical protein [Clostridia bacterium]